MAKIPNNKKQKKMTESQKEEVTEISKSFFSGFAGTFDEINGTGMLVVDPLSAYLNVSGFRNTISQIPGNEKHPLVLILEFKDGSKFIPAGGDLKTLQNDFENWMWI